MAEDGNMGENMDNTSKGVAGHHASEVQPSAFRAQPSSPLDSTSLWTQFSGIPSHPGSPSSLHQWLHAMEGPGLSSDIFPRSPAPQMEAGFSPPPAIPKSFSSMHSTLNDSPGDYGHAGQSNRIPLQLSSASHQFDLRSAPDFDFSIPRPHQFSHSPLSDASDAPPVSFAGLPPADFSRPPPDFTFGASPDFSRPPPLFLPNLSQPPFPAADLRPPCSPNFASSSDHRDIGHKVSDKPSSFPLNPQPPHFEFDSGSQNEDTVPKPLDLFSGHINLRVPPPNYVPFSTFGDDLFTRPADFDASLQDFNASLQEPDFGKMDGEPRKPKKILRQNSEPACKKTAEQEGKAMYMEALRRLNSFGPSYEPFGTKPAEPEDMTETATSASPPQLKDDSPAKPVKNEPAKMSYSDAARCLRGKSAQTKPDYPGGFLMQEKDMVEAENGVPTKKVMSDATLKPPRQHSSKRQSCSKSGSLRSCDNMDAGQSFVQPTSRYGLDQFEDLSDGSFGKGEHCSSSMESLNMSSSPAGTRKSSTSSLSSSTSAVEEILHMKSASSSCVGKMDAGVMKQRDKPSAIGTKDLKEQLAENHTNSTTTFPTNQAPEPAASTNTQKSKNEKLFFDPKRIFQSRGSSTKSQSTAEQPKAGAEKVQNDGDCSDLGKEETVLNNGKPNNASSKATSATQRKADYINNDLREGGSGGVNVSGGSSCGGGGGSKRTNQTAALNRHSHSVHSKKHGSQKDSFSQDGTSDSKPKGGGDSRGKKQEAAAAENAEKGPSFIRNIDWVLVDEWMKYISECTMTFARNFATAAVTILFYLVGVIMYLVMGVIHLIAIGVGMLWSVVKGKLFKADDQRPGRWGQYPNSSDSSRKRFGLEENIALPATGEEAMKRLLACKGKDPYSILGLRCDTSDEDIKRYYRKQAVLVHPDKNQEPGAEEAFKILGHAFEMIGESAKRKEYDAHILETSEAEAAMREFSDLLTKLQEKVQEAANMMRCDNCGKKHRRISVDRPWYSARYCERCHIHHSAKEGDVWAESSLLGFLWHYYACMEGNIYDITEWVSCQRENFRQMKANAHPVYYRIQTDGNRRHRHGQSGEADLEDFINRLFTKASMNPDGTPPPGWQFPSQQGAGAGAQPGWGTSTGASNGKRSRRKKKRN